MELSFGATSLLISSKLRIVLLISLAAFFAFLLVEVKVSPKDTATFFATV